MNTLIDLLTSKIRQLETTLDHVGAYVYTKDMGGRYTYVNKMVCELFGCPLELIIGATDEEFFDLSISNDLRINDRRVLDQGEHIEAEETNVTLTSETYIFWTVKLPLRGPDGSIIGMCGISTDITERKQAEKALEESKRTFEAISITDGLTGIANRRRFDEALSLEYARHARSGAQLSLIMLDIDCFKAFNDTYGHIAGDNCLQQIGRAITNCAARPADLSARYGGEEFACILPETDHVGAVIIAERIRRAIQALAIPHKASDTADYVTASLGVGTMYCKTEGSSINLIAQADELLYLAKSRGRNRVEFSVPDEHPLAATEKTHGNFVRMVWNDSFNCGNLLIDSQHQSLFHLCNELLEAVLSGRPTADSLVLISRLLDDVGKHFHDEETILAKAAFPGMSQHAAEHARLLAKGVELSQQFFRSAFPVGDLIQFLAYDIVMMHMLGADREYYPFIQDAVLENDRSAL